jgi:potassium/hydrogen antiporter
MSTTILIIGLMVFFAHFLSLQFRKTNIPDVLVLMLVGTVIGPMLGIASPQDFGKISSLIATIALVVILFEGGTSLNLDVLGKSLGTTGLLALACFALTAVIVTLIGFYALGLALLPATLLGVTLGNTSSAVVIPMVSALRLSEKPATVLVRESALTDVLSIVGVFALLQIHTQGGVEPGKLVSSVLAALIFAAAIGVLGGIGWLLVLGKVRLPQYHLLHAGLCVHPLWPDRDPGLFRRDRRAGPRHHPDQFREVRTVPHPEHRQEPRAAERNGSDLL